MNEEVRQLRKMTNEDIATVYAIECACHDFPWTEGLLSDCLRVGYLANVVEIDSNIRAFMIRSRAAGECHIMNVAVLPDYQRKGVATALVQMAIEQERKLGTERIILEVRQSNTAAIKLYERFGFTPLAIRKAYYPSNDGKEDALVYEYKF